jgi:hypothetical protein
LQSAYAGEIDSATAVSGNGDRCYPSRFVNSKKKGKRSAKNTMIKRVSLYKFDCVCYVMSETVIIVPIAFREHKFRLTY